jgi:hypothetical protein
MVVCKADQVSKNLSSIPCLPVHLPKAGASGIYSSVDE